MSVSLLIDPFSSLWDSTGSALAGTLEFYEAGTSTPLDTFTTSAGDVANSNPLSLTGGRATVYGTNEKRYKVVLKDASGATLKTLDNMSTVNATSGDTKIYDTIAAAVADVANISIGNVVTVKERATGKGGGGIWDAVDATTVTENEYNIVTGTASVSFVLRNPNNYLDMAAWGANDAATDCGLIATSAQTQYPMVPQVYPSGTLVFQTGVSFQSGSDSTFNIGPTINGAGVGLTIFDNQVSSGALFDLSNGGTPGTHFMMGVELSDFKIISTTGTNQIGIKLSTAYLVDIKKVHIDGLTGNGIEIPCIDDPGDYDGSNMVRMEHVRVENCTGWGIKADGQQEIPSPFQAGNNETSYILMEHCFIQGNGADDYTAITGITQANPGVVTASGHGFSNGDVVAIFGVVGMTELNSGYYTVAGATSTTFQLSGVDTTSYTAYSSGGVTGPKEPTSGGMIWKGQVFNTNQSAFVLNQNVGLFIIGGGGLGQNVSLDNTTFENGHKRSLFVRGVKTLYGRNLQMYHNATGLGYVGYEFDGTDSVVDSINLDGVLVRATTDNNAFTAFKTTGGNAYLGNISVKNVVWDNFDHTGQTRYSGLKDNPAIVAYRTSAGSLTTSYGNIIMDTEVSDEQGCYDSSGDITISLYQGLFRVSGRITLTSLSAGTAISIELYNSTTATQVAELIKTAGGVTTESFDFEFVAELGATLLTRQYRVRAKASTGTPALDVSNIGYNYISVNRIKSQD